MKITLNKANKLRNELSKVIPTLAPKAFFKLNIEEKDFLKVLDKASEETQVQILLVSNAIENLYKLLGIISDANKDNGVDVI